MLSAGIDATSLFFFFFSSRRRHTRLQGDWSSDVCSSDLREAAGGPKVPEINGVQRNKVNPVLIPGIGGLAEMLLIGISHIEIPVMLSGDVFDLGFQGRK